MWKLAVLVTTIALPVPALAFIECAGETHGGTIVQVSVNTQGTMGYVTGGEVTITPKTGAARSYKIKSDEIPQFFESVDGNHERAIVGLSAYINYEFPVQIRYVGKNYDFDLMKVLRTPGRKKEPGNSMIVWKGPEFADSEQHSFADVVCSVSLDP